ncbi:hypothetical protein N665_0131s0004 [Sinapis alba]|nr:hypothetical protein N665_0131s0004 [Sinapis alba]
MFENKFMAFGGFHGDFNIARASDRRLPQNVDTNPFLKNQCYNQSKDGIDLCKRLNKMGISCDMDDFGSKEARHWFDQNLPSRIPNGFRNVSSAHEVSPFVVEVATKNCAEIATHRHGCCVLQCCVANTVGEQRERLVDEISRNALQLSQDPFGNYVVQYIIEQNVPAGKFLRQFRMHYAKLATQKFSSHVVEKCLNHYPESRAEIVRELTSVPNFGYLLQDPFGNYVIQTALSKTKGRVHAKLVDQVHKYGILKSNPYCKKIFSKGVLKK